MTWQEWISILSGPIGIAVTASIAIYTIRKTAEESRVTNIHTELCACLVDTVSIVDDILTLLDDVANHVVYQSIPEEKITETAYARYWREISPLAERFKKIKVKQRLVFPRKLYEDVQVIVKKVNVARSLARQAAPNDDHTYPDTRELRSTVDEAISAYLNFLHESRKYLGTDRLEPITLVSELPIKAKEDKVQEGKS